MVIHWIDLLQINETLANYVKTKQQSILFIMGGSWAKIPMPLLSCCNIMLNWDGFSLWQAMSLQNKFHKVDYMFAEKIWTFFSSTTWTDPITPVLNWPAQKLGLPEGRGGCHQVIHRLMSLTLSLTWTCNNLCVFKSVSLFSLVCFYICVFFCREVTGYS